MKAEYTWDTKVLRAFRVHAGSVLLFFFSPHTKHARSLGMPTATT